MGFTIIKAINAFNRRRIAFISPHSTQTRSCPRPFYRNSPHSLCYSTHSPHSPHSLTKRMMGSAKSKEQSITPSSPHSKKSTGNLSGDNDVEIATVAGGCFWGMEKLLAKYLKQRGALVSISVGYCGGPSSEATYKAVCRGNSGHAEAVQIEFHPSKVTYSELITYFFSIHDPTTPNRQGADKGTQYRSAIFCHNEKQEEEAKKVKAAVNPKWDNKIVTEVHSANESVKYYLAEEYHQNYLEKNPTGYCSHRVHY
eukprot:GHVN01044511.1.p1 GENE.GHVN01044511.1~~GHVN01044511.1.p1  ORF type:complete len:255 (-),score=71.27 GHVN01044511.1:417-1181(-)